MRQQQLHKLVVHCLYADHHFSAVPANTISLRFFISEKSHFSRWKDIRIMFEERYLWNRAAKTWLVLIGMSLLIWINIKGLINSACHSKISIWNHRRINANSFDFHCVQCTNFSILQTYTTIFKTSGMSLSI